MKCEEINGIKVCRSTEEYKCTWLLKLSLAISTLCKEIQSVKQCSSNIKIQSYSYINDLPQTCISKQNVKDLLEYKEDYEKYL